MLETDWQTCCTVETPSRLILFYPDSTPCTLTSFLPSLPISRPVGSNVTLGRSSAADIRLNDERMSRLYASLWHDGKDPFIFRVSNVSERKTLIVDGALLRYKEETEVKDGTSLTLDFWTLKARVCGGDLVASCYQVSLVKNVVMSPPPVSPSDFPLPGKVLMPSSDRRCSVPGRDLSSVFSCSSKTHSTPNSTNAADVVTKLLSCLQSVSLDSGLGLNRTSNPEITSRQRNSLDSAVGSRSGAERFPGYAFDSRRHSDDVGVEYELPENISTVAASRRPPVVNPPSGLPAANLSPWVNVTDNRLSLSIPLPQVQSAMASAPLPASAFPEHQNFTMCLQTLALDQAVQEKKSTEKWNSANRYDYPTPGQHKQNFFYPSAVPLEKTQLTSTAESKASQVDWTASRQDKYSVSTQRFQNNFFQPAQIPQASHDSQLTAPENQQNVTMQIPNTDFIENINTTQQTHNNVCTLCSAQQQMTHQALEETRSKNQPQAAEQHCSPSQPQQPCRSAPHQQPQQLYSYIAPTTNRLSAGSVRDFTCWFTDTAAMEKKSKSQKVEDAAPSCLQDIAQQVQNALVFSGKNQQAECAVRKCRYRNDGTNVEKTLNVDENGTSGNSINMMVNAKADPDMTAFVDMLNNTGEGRRSPEENQEWDTDDPNINCYMK